MTDDELRVEISSSDGGMENTVKIRGEEDLQVAVEALQLAARYEFDGDIEVFSESSGELSELVERIEQLDEELDGVEQDIGELIEESVSDSDLESELSDLQKQFNEKFSELIELAEQHTTENFRVFTDEEDDDAALLKETVRNKLRAKVSEKGEVPNSWTPMAEEILEELHDQGMAQNWGHHRNVMDATLDLRRELEKEFESGDDGSGDKYTCSDCGKSFSSVVKTRSTHHDCHPNSGENLDDDGEKEAVEESDPEEEGEDAPSTAEEGAYDLEWKTVDEAVGDYKDSDDLKFLLCIRSMKAYTSPLMAQNHAEEGEGAVWAASEDVPEEFVS